MLGTILLNHSENTKQIEAEEKARFLKSILDQMGVPMNDIWDTDAPPTVEQKIKLMHLFAKYGIQTLDDQDGKLEIFVEGECIAKWNKPTYKLKRDYKQRDTKKQLFLEMTVDFWSLFEENNIDE